MNHVWINGKADTTLQISDRGLAYGDGLFETIKVNNGHVCLLQEHLHRLKSSCARLGIPFDFDAIKRDIDKAIAAIELRSGVMKITITRGQGGRGYRPPVSAEPTHIVSLHPLPDYPQSFWEQGVSVRVCDHQLGLNPALAGMKTLNRLDQVLARSEWDDANIPEALLTDINGALVEATQCNVFWREQGQIFTPKLDQAGIKGVMREWVIKKLPKVQEVGVPITRLEHADEIWLTNSIIGIWPVQQVSGRRFDSFPTSHTLLETMRLEQVV